MCNLEERKQVELDKIINIYLGNIENFTKQGNILFFNKIDYTYSQLKGILKNSEKRVNEYIKNTYGEKFIKGWAELKNFKDFYEVHFKFPKLLSDAYEVKENISSYKEKFNEIPSVSLEDENDLSYFNEEGDYVVRYSTNTTINKNLREGLNWLKTIMPDVNPIIVEGLIDNIANGSYNILTDLITLSNDFANKKVVKEEAFHRIFNLLPKVEQEKLLNEGSKKYNIKRGKSKVIIKYSLEQQNQINYVFKVIDSIQNKIWKVNQWYKQLGNTDIFWDKVQKDLQIPKEQINLLKKSEGNTIEEKLISFAANYSYAIEINTSVEPSVSQEHLDDGLIPTQEYLDIIGKPTQLYSNLTVPGGTNYTENEIATPGVEIQEKPQGVPVKQGVSELFESNPELANAVYEALGFDNNKNLNVRNSIVKAYKDKTTIELPLTLLESLIEFDRVANPNRIVPAQLGEKDKLNPFNNIKEMTSRENIDRIKESITKNGFNGYLEISLNSKGALALTEGNHRLQALKELGYTNVPVKVLGRNTVEGEYFQMVENGKTRQYGLNLNKDFNTQITPQQKQQAQQLYSQYLDTIFPDSKVKDIVYHGGKTNKDSFKRFVDKTKYKDRNPNSILGFFFSSSRNTVAGQYAEKDYDAIKEHLTGDAETDAFIRRSAPLKKGSVSEELLNIKNPYIIQAEEWENETWVDKLNILTEKDKDNDWVSDYKWTVDAYEKVKNHLQSLGYDGLYINSNKELFNKTGIVDYITVQKVVFEPEQIHILGSKQDREGFKSFIKSNTKTVRKGAITPSIKGHAQFSTPNGIGWFRSDDKENKVVGWKEEDDFLNSETAQYNPITKDDKIIWGHPAIGKSYAAKKVKMIDFDSYKLGINKKYNLYIAPGLSDTELRTDDKTREARENWRYESEENQTLWNQFIRDVWQQAKKDAKEQEAILFASDLLVLREFGNEVDKALTMPDELFFERSKQRNNFIEGELGTKVWKGNLNRAVNNFKEKFGKDKVISTEKYLSDLLEGNPKTRRILEVQSDLFQKGRDKEDLILKQKEDSLYTGIKQETTQELYKEAKNKGKEVFAYHDYYYLYNNKYYSYSSINNKYYVSENNSKINTSENQFLQLLNKDNNWVTFFVKSIIQDSAKKGYEKVLFPTGNTASKVEGHSTLEEFKKQKEDRIKELEELINHQEKLSIEEYGEIDEYAQNYIEKEQNEIKQLKQELERVETEGFGALKPIYNFYENTVTNILKKQGYNPILITDENGNTWNEIILTPKMLENIRLNTLEGRIEYTGDLAIEEKMAEEAFNSKDEKVATTLIGKFIQSIKNMLRNIFKEKDNISRLIRNMNQGKFKNMNKKFEQIYKEILSLPEEDTIESIKKCLI